MNKEPAKSAGDGDQRAGSDAEDQPELILPDGSPAVSKETTERSKERQTEDEKYVPVIIKRTDETRRHPDDALDNAIREGLEQLRRPALSLAFASVAAGMIVGFSAMAVAVVLASMDSSQGDLDRRIATALVYPLGFVVCILSGAQLFTEHTATAFYPVLDKQASLKQLIRLWAIVISGNLIGAAACAALLRAADEVIGARQGYLEIGHHLVHFSTLGLLISGILAGWLMALGAWLTVSSPRTIAQITEIYCATFLIGIGGLHHSIAGSVEMFTALLMSSEFTALMAARFIAIALIGNLIGGSCFVALLNYGHIRRTNE